MKNLLLLILPVLLFHLALQAFANPKTKSGQEVGSIGFGSNGPFFYWNFEDAIKSGYRLFDSADLYDNSEHLAKAIIRSRINREEFFINYKVIPKGKKRFLRRVNAAIKRFGYIDSLMLHDTRGEEVYIAELLKALRPYIDSGKIRYAGLSNVRSPEQLEKIKSLAPDIPISLVQNKFNQYCQDENVRGLCRRQGITYMGYELFGGRLDSFCSYSSQVTIPIWNLAEGTFPILHRLAQKHKLSPHEVLLGWATQVQETVQIPSTLHPERMSQNIKIGNNVERITSDEWRELSDSLRAEISDEEFQKLKAAEKTREPLNALKAMIGKSTVRHRIIENLYHEDQLQKLFDLILFIDPNPEHLQNDEPQTEENRILIKIRQARFERARISNLVYLVHFLEESIRKNEYNKVLHQLKTVSENAEPMAVLNIIRNLDPQTGAGKQYEFRRDYLEDHFKKISGEVVGKAAKTQ